jgi:hypothetical protein
MAVGEYGTATATPGFGQLVQLVRAKARAQGSFLFVKHKQPALRDTAAIAALRADLLTVLSAPSDGGLVVDNGWTVRYAARRIALHVLDHVWEMQDRVP